MKQSPHRLDSHGRVRPSEFLEREVLPRLTVEALYADATFTKKKGRHWRAACPLHGGDNPAAFSVDTETLRWACFSQCQDGGDAIAYVYRRGGGSGYPRGREYVDAIRKLADLAGVDASVLDCPPTEDDAAVAGRAALLETFFAQAQAALLGEAGKAARVYVEYRELDNEGLGLYTSPEDVRARLLAVGHATEDVAAAGLQDGRWAARLVIPWRDRWGRLATFAARDLSPHAEEAEKYLYLLGTKKADLVAFGLDVALKHAKGKLLLVEGVLDVVNFQSRGLLAVVAIGGAGGELSAERWAALGRLGVRSATLALDNDAAGRKGTLAALTNASNVTNAPVISVLDPADLGDTKDPDEYVRRNGLEAFHRLLNGQQAGTVYLAAVSLQGVAPASPDAVKREALASVGAHLETRRGPWAKVDEEAVVSLIAERTGYSKNAISEFFRATEKKRRTTEAGRALADALRDAERRRQNGEAPIEIVRTIAPALDRVGARAMDEPPAFSVGRLLEESQRVPVGLTSRWSILDLEGVRFNAGELALLAARTGHAKTSTLVGLLHNWLAEESGGVFLFYSLEEGEVRIFHRLLALATACDKSGGRWTANEVRDYLRGGLELTPDPKTLRAAQDRLRSMEDRLLIVHNAGWTAEDLSSHARAVAETRTVRGVLVDYLQRLPAPAGRYDRRDIEVSAVGRCLKTLAEDISSPVVVGAQINREVAKDVKVPTDKPYKDDKVQTALRALRPKLHHLREGGSEQEADLVLGLMNFRADYVMDDEGDLRRDVKVPNVTRLEVGTLKYRYGKPGRWVGLAFEGQYGLIRDPADEDDL